MTRLIELIYTETHRGDGTPENPHRILSQLFSKGGDLVAQQGTKFDVAEFYPENIEEVRQR